MNALARSLGLVAAALWLASCKTLLPGEPRAEPPTLPPIAAMRKGQSGGVFTLETPWTLVSDSRAFRPGDALTVTLEEVTQASKSANTSFDKKSAIAVTPATMGGKTLKSDLSVTGDRSFAGTTASTQQNALQGSITVIVQDVLPNGMLRISGEKSLRLNQGEEFIRVVGYVRSADIDTDNRVSSLRIANAGITYSGRGTLNDANQPGWLIRFFTGPYMPF
jgi:flagellar L-ring protein precursor FlgH